MACSSFEYVKHYEDDPPIPLNCWFIIRIDGRSYRLFADAHNFHKPNDNRACSLMVDCAQEVMKEFDDIILAYGQSDEFSFLFKRTTKLWKRRKSKILSTVVSLFSSVYVYKWSHYFDCKMKYPPSYDARIVPYPTDKDIMDYFRWRQADCHINNLYNTCFWSLISDGQTTQEANNYLSFTNSADKNELLFTRFNINYNSEPQLFRKGTIILRMPKKSLDYPPTEPKQDSLLVTAELPKFKLLNRDLISQRFWEIYFSDFDITNSH